MSLKAEQFKVVGNALFKEEKWKESAVQYTKAIKEEPENHVYYRFVPYELCPICSAPQGLTHTQQPLCRVCQDATLQPRDR